MASTLKHERGLLCASADKVAPTPFGQARRAIYSKWATTDALVQEYRDWMMHFEDARDALIARGGEVPCFPFDRALAYLHDRFRRGVAPEGAIFEDLLSLAISPERAPWHATVSF